MTIRSKLFLVFILSLFCSFALLAYWMDDEIKAFHNQSFEEVLVDTAHALAEIVADDLRHSQSDLKSLHTALQKAKAREFSAQIYGLKKQNFDLRVYVTDNLGKIVFDSNSIENIGVDYSKWRDVSLTLQGEYGARTSDEMIIDADGNEEEVSVAYVAAPVFIDNEIVAVVSVGKPKTNIQKFIELAKQDVIAAMLLSLLLALVLGFAIYVWVSRPLKLLVLYANKVMRGERAEPPLNGGLEIKQVAQSMANMRSALEDKQYVERYVQTLTHEMKSPLTAIMAAAEILQSDLPEDKRLKFTSNILLEAGRLNDFANELLQLAAVEKLDRLANVEKVDLVALLHTLIVSFEPVLVKKSLTIDTQLPSSAYIRGDAFLLKQAVENLLRNAIEFSPEHGGISLVVNSSDSGCDIVVEDNGAGIPEYALDHIFERFYSLPRPSGKNSTGLGLNFVQEVAELHKGYVKLNNKTGSLGVIAKLHIKHT